MAAMTQCTYSCCSHLLLLMLLMVVLAGGMFSKVLLCCGRLGLRGHRDQDLPVCLCVLL